MARLDGTTVLITGGGSGIGLATARLLLGEGARVAIAGRDEAKLRRAAEGLEGGERLLVQPADVTDTAQVKALVEWVTARFGRIDVLVNNAGANVKNRTVRELDPETWDRLVRINLDGAFYCIHAVLPQMRERKDGVIVNINSVAGKRATPISGGAYSAAKFGMASLGLAVGVEEKDNNIRVTNVYPGEVDTPILENRPVPVTPEHRARILQSDDVAAAALFVAGLPPHVSVPELVIKPTAHVYF